MMPADVIVLVVALGSLFGVAVWGMCSDVIEREARDAAREADRESRLRAELRRHR